MQSLNSETLLLNLVRQCEFTLGAVAWNGYACQGRGYLYLPLYREAGMITTKRLAYVSSASPLGVKLRQGATAQAQAFWDAVATYSPETEFVVMASIPDQRDEVWTHCQPSIAPKAVHASALQRPKEFDIAF